MNSEIDLELEKLRSMGWIRISQVSERKLKRQTRRNRMQKRVLMMRMILQELKWKHSLVKISVSWRVR